MILQQQHPFPSCSQQHDITIEQQINYITIQQQSSDISTQQQIHDITTQQQHNILQKQQDDIMIKQQQMNCYFCSRCPLWWSWILSSQWRSLNYIQSRIQNKINLFCFRCRVDFQDAQTRNSFVHVNVIGKKKTKNSPT